MAPMSSLPRQIGKPPPEMNMTGVIADTQYVDQDSLHG
jgi:hypothetical protein